MKGWKTITFNAITGILALVNLFQVNEFLPEMLHISNQTLLAVSVVGNFLLRFITDSPIGFLKRKLVEKKDNSITN